MKIKVIFSVIVSSYLLFSGLIMVNAQSKKADRPNIIILFADDLGWNDISSPLTTINNGSKNHQTPNIDQLAREGVSFEHAYSQQNCVPSRAALLTGQYAPVTGVYNVGSLARYGGVVVEKDTRIIPPAQNNVISPKSVTFAETLKQVGYKTYIFGKVHGWNGDLSKDHGFDVDLSCSKTIKGYKNSDYMSVQDADGTWIYDNPKYNKFAVPYTKDYIEANIIPYSNNNEPLSLIGTPKHFTDAITDVVVDEIKLADKDQPFCMWVCYHAIHSAIVGRDDLNAKYENRTTLDPRHTQVQYGALVEQLDQSVARILAYLEEQNLSENTVVIFASDNGGVGEDHNHINLPLRGGKGMFYEGGVRVPLIIKYPGITQPGLIVKEPVHFIDFYPTLAEIAGAQLPSVKIHPLNGESFYGLISGSKEHLNRDAIFWHFPGYMDFRQEPNTVMVKRIENSWYKLRFSYENDTYELYNLDNDLGEEVQLLKEGNVLESDIEKAEAMRNEMIQWLEEMKPAKMIYRKSKIEVGLPGPLAGNNVVDLSSDNTIIYYNNGKVNIKTTVNDKNSSVNVFSLTGEVVHKNTISLKNGSNSFDLKLKPGIYIIELLTKTGEMTQKIVL